MRALLHGYSKLSIEVCAAFWFTVWSVFNRAINLPTMPFFTRLISAEEYGVVTFYNSWLSILLAVVALNVYGGCFNTAIDLIKLNRKDLLVRPDACGYPLRIGFDCFNPVFGFD